MKDLLLMRAPLKYIQGEGALEHFYENCKSFGKKYLFVSKVLVKNTFLFVLIAVMNKPKI